jgi:hypothetical protein
MVNSQPDSNPGLDLAVVGPLLSQLRDNLSTLLLGLQDVLFELDVEGQREVAEQVNLVLERVRGSSFGASNNPN